MEIKKLLAVLMYYQHNMKILHWKASGLDFDTYHNLTSDYYNEMQNHIDLIAEIAISLDEDPLGLMEAYKVLDDDKNEYKILKADSNYSGSEVVENLDIMFKDILECIKELIKDDKIEAHIGAKAKLEEMYAWYDIEYNYKNKRRKK